MSIGCSGNFNSIICHVNYEQNLFPDKYFCSTCPMSFPFKSKLERHLQSDNHKLFTQCLEQTMEPDDCDDLYDQSQVHKFVTLGD